MKQDKGWVLPRKHTGHSKHSLPTTKETNLHVDITTYENTNTLATWWEELTYLKRPWCWERLKAWGEGDDRGWDGWMASPRQWTWVWGNSGSWWWTGRGLVCCSPWGSKESDTTEQLKWTETMVEVMKKMATSFKRPHASTATLRAPNPEAGHCWPAPPQETLRHSSVSASVGYLGPGVHKVCLSSLRVSGRYEVWF